MAIIESTDLRSELHLFVRIVEAGSLRAVALEQGVQPSSVTRRLARLEARLGVKLIVRSRVRSTPTDAGRRYYEALRPLLDQLDALELDIRGQAEVPSGLLRVAAPVDFGARFVTPVLEAMQRDFPELRVDLKLGSHFADLIEERIDVAVRIGRLSDSALVAARLGVVGRVLVASPGYLARRGRPERPTELGAHDFIFYRNAQHRGQITFEDGSQVAVSGRFSVNSVTAISRLVIGDMGMHLGPRWAFQRAIDAGEVAVVLPDFPLRAYPLHALRAPSELVPAKTRTFIDRMRQAASDAPGLAPP